WQNPEQLFVAQELINKVKSKCCGIKVHQTANNEIEYYPLWIDRMNLRFVYRMYKEKHTRKRYVQAALLFPARFLWEKLIFSWYKDSKPL
ncbi:hypothetical protein PL690_21470, partial [Phocaeicola vulgatus]|nr:hypothetical protein [Phocaeicola vulgatus]